MKYNMTNNCGIHYLEEFMWFIEEKLNTDKDFEDMILKGTVGCSYSRYIIAEFINKATEFDIIDFFKDYITINAKSVGIPMYDYEFFIGDRGEMSKFLIYEVVILFFQKYIYYHFLNKVMNIRRREDHMGKPLEIDSIAEVKKLNEYLKQKEEEEENDLPF